MKHRSVAFTDASTGSPTSWAWDFENDGVVDSTLSSGTPTAWAWDFENDGVVDSTEQNPTYTYTTAATYPVNLTVTGEGGSDSVVKTDYLTVTEPTGPSVLPDYNNIFFNVANDASVNVQRLREQHLQRQVRRLRPRSQRSAYLHRPSRELRPGDGL